MKWPLQEPPWFLCCFQSCPFGSTSFFLISRGKWMEMGIPKNRILRNGARARVSIRELLDWEVLSDKFNPFRLSTPTGLESRLRRYLPHPSPERKQQVHCWNHRLELPRPTATFACICMNFVHRNSTDLVCSFDIVQFSSFLLLCKRPEGTMPFPCSSFPIFWTLSLLQCGG